MKNQFVGEPKAPDRFRFQLWHLFYLTALIAVGIVVAGVFSLVISCGVLVAWWSWCRLGWSWKIAAVIMVVVGLIWLAMPTVYVYREAPRWASSLNNQKNLILAMLNYESVNGHLPPVWQEDEEGQSMHSWRVLILPYLECSLYDLYDFDEPWDGPNNSKLVNQMPQFYQNPRGGRAATGQTPYKLVVDEGSFFNAGEEGSLDDAVDGDSKTMVLVEDAANPVNWMKPDGISIDDAVAVLTDEKFCYRGQDESPYYNSLLFQNVAMLNGSVHRINPDVDPDLLRSSMLAADGVSPDLSMLDQRISVAKPRGFIALTLYVFLLALPGWMLRKRSAV